MNKHKLLIVDDDKVSGQLLQKRVERKDYECLFVTSGKDCLDILAKEKFDAVFLDIMMPDMSGVEVLDEIRKKYNRFELPVIMVTSKDEAKDIVDALKRSANDYLVKPVNIEIALARLNTQVQLKVLFQESLKTKQLDTIKSMVATLNHEINNPLAVAVGNISISFDKIDKKKVDKALLALEKVADIVKKIDEIATGEVTETNYSDSINIFDIHN